MSLQCLEEVESSKQCLKVESTMLTSLIVHGQEVELDNKLSLPCLEVEATLSTN